MTARQPLTREEIEAALNELNGWSYEDEQLKRTLTFQDFREAVSFIVRLAFHAEELNHHPSLTNVYNRLEVALTTHDAGDRVTKMDVTLAQAIDSLLAS